MFADLISHYVSAMNSDCVPTISTAWERVMDSEIRRVFDSACEEFEFFVADHISGKLPLDGPELKELYRVGKRRSLQILNSGTVANAPPEKIIEMREKFDEKLETSLDHIE